MYVEGSEPILNNVLIVDNTGWGGGGIFYKECNSCGITNNVTFENNISVPSFFGEAFYLSGDADPTFTNCIIRGTWYLGNCFNGNIESTAAVIHSTIGLGLCYDEWHSWTTQR